MAKASRGAGPTAAVALLARERVAFTVHEYAHDPAAASYGLEAAAALGRDPDQVFKTLLVVHDLYPSKEALDEDIGSGSTSWNDETFNQLDELLGSPTNME